MSLSERDRKVLERLEQEFGPSLPVRATLRWSRISPLTRVLTGAVALLLGLPGVLLGLALNDAGGDALAVVAYLLVTAGAAVLVGRVLAAPARRRASRSAGRQPRYLR